MKKVTFLKLKQAQANLTDLLKLLKLNDFQSNQKSEMEKNDRKKNMDDRKYKTSRM